jgi:hypothetical protein
MRWERTDELEKLRCFAKKFCKLEGIGVKCEGNPEEGRTEKKIIRIRYYKLNQRSKRSIMVEKIKKMYQSSHHLMNRKKKS